jgi:hypothetical protein
MLHRIKYFWQNNGKYSLLFCKKYTKNNRTLPKAIIFLISTLCKPKKPSPSLN